MHEPHELHWKATKRIVHYVQDTREFEIHYSTSGQLDLIGFNNLDWDGDSIDRKYTSIFVFMLGSGPIYWSSKKQVALALSSAEAKYRGFVNATIQEFWLHAILREFSIHTSPSIDISYDNQSEIKIYSDPLQKQRTKHIEVHMHYIRELVHNRTITLHYFPTEEHIPNIFTKYFTKKIFFYLKSLLSVKAD